MTTIIKATTNEATLLADIGKKTFVESHGNSASAADIGSYVSGKFSFDIIKEELSNAKNILHIIYYKGQPAGYSKIIFNTPHPNIAAQNITKLERLYLLKEFYNLKLGLMLFEFIVDLSKKSGQAGTWLYVWKENKRAVNFYKKAGFVIVGHTDFKISETHSNPNFHMYLEY